MKKLVLILVLIAGVWLSACNANIPIAGKTVRGSGRVVEEERSVSNFSRVDLAGFGDLIVQQGDDEGLHISAEDNLLPYIETEVKGDTLEISARDGVNLNPRKEIRYTLTVKELNSVAVSGLGNIELPVWQSEHFEVTLSGSGDIDIESLNAQSLRVDISGLGNLDIGGGRVVSQDITISGGGNYRARDLASESANVEISGLGDATVRVSDYLQADVSGSGSIDYVGNPEVEANTSGLGNIGRIKD